VVTISATKATATQPTLGTNATDTGTITVTRGGVLLFSAITVPLNWNGTAVAGVDYASLPAVGDHSGACEFGDDLGGADGERESADGSDGNGECDARRRLHDWHRRRAPAY